MKCPCEIDHWHHLAAGFQGIVSMMGVLLHNNVTPTPHAFSKLDEQLGNLKAVIDAAKEKVRCQGEVSGTG